MTLIRDRIPHLKSPQEADYLVFTYGAAEGGAKQETPAFLMRLAEQGKKVHAIHYDRQFAADEHSYCATHSEWQKIEEEGDRRVAEGDRRVYRHEKFSNFQVTLVSTNLPSDQEALKQLTKFCFRAIRSGTTVFLGVHANCFEDQECILSAVNNSLGKLFPGKIHLYIQAGSRDAFVYSKRHANIMGMFAFHVLYKDYSQTKELNLEDFAALKKAFSEKGADAKAVERIRALMEAFIKVESVFGLDRLAYIQQHGSELMAFLDDPEHYKLRILPMDEVTPAIFGLETAPKSDA